MGPLGIEPRPTDSKSDVLTTVLSKTLKLSNAGSNWPCILSVTRKIINKKKEPSQNLNSVLSGQKINLSCSPFTCWLNMGDLQILEISSETLKDNQIQTNI